MGNSIREIAAAKAGIIKKNIPAIISKQSPTVKRILEKKCIENSNEVIWAADAFSVSNSRKSITYKHRSRFIEFPFPNLIGKHQISNAMTAISALIHLDIPVKYICGGLKNTYWPARLQKIEKGNLFNLITDYNVKNELWIDGGHNADASVQLKNSMNFINKKNLHVIYGSLKNKDHISFLKNLTVIASSLCVVDIEQQSSSLPKTEAVVVAKEAGWNKIQTAKNIREAIKYICSKDDSYDSQVSILICGSLYLAGEALKQNDILI